MIKRNTTIRKLNAAILLLLFLFGSTPKLYLHNLIATHKDDIVAGNSSKQTTVAKLPVYCHCDNIVIESPFLPDDAKIEIQQAVAYTPFASCYIDNYNLPHQSYFELRGPPNRINS